jgi:hypothetical protein
VTALDTPLIVSYVSARSERYAAGAALVPSSPNCGSQKRLRLGSLPMMTCSIEGASRTTAAA